MDMDEDADGFLQNLTDKDLRSVFNGLVEGAEEAEIIVDLPHGAGDRL